MGKEKNIFDFFSQSAIQQFKEAFGIMDVNKDGILSADDLVAAFTAVGKSSAQAKLRLCWTRPHLQSTSPRW
jgi:Ca2+-binding EF-hand superfamily protein